MKQMEAEHRAEVHSQQSRRHSRVRYPWRVRRVVAHRLLVSRPFSAPRAILSAVSGSIESSIGTQNYDDVSGNGLRFTRLA
jgi:hypothetical protein